MPVQGVPPTYRRGTSFTRYAIDRPTQPLPGDRLDQELDDIAYVLDGRAAELATLVGADGRLRSGVVGEANLAPGLFDHIATRGADRLIPLLSDALTAAERAQRYANDAGTFVQTVQRAADAAHADAFVAHEAKLTIQSLWSDFERVAAGFDEVEELAANSADTAEAFMVQAEAARDMSEKWAEYLAGPVQPAPPGWPEAIDDGMWSSKWWAVRASEIVGTWGNWYLGAFATAPVVPASGPWPPGTLYYDTTTGEMRVWTGTAWAPMHTPGLSVQFSYTYVATANQTTFGGADIHGRIPAIDTDAPQQVDVHANGVRLVRNELDGQVGDYTVVNQPFSVTIAVPLPAGSVVALDLLVSPTQVAPGAALVYPVTAPVFDGVATTFALVYVSPDDGATKPVTATWATQLLIHLDGVAQSVGADYTLNASGQLVFTQAPPASTAWNAVWFVPGGSVGQVTAGRIINREWNLDAQTTAGPSAGRLRLNNAAQGLATIVWIANVAADSADVRNLLLTIKTGAEVYVQATGDSSKWARYVATGSAIDRTTYVEIPVGFMSGGAQMPANRVLVMVYQ